MEEALREKITLESKYRASPPLEDFVNVIEQLHEVGLSLRHLLELP